MIIEIDEKFLEQLKTNLSEYDDFWNDKILEEEFKNPNSQYYVLVKNDELIGFGGLWFNIDEAHIMNIAINKKFRRNGFASEILDYLISVTHKKSKKILTLEVRANNIPAIKLYEKFDFKNVGKRKKYYNNEIDAIIMTKYFENDL